MPNLTSRPDNPCKLPLESDQLPAKIWELLRRNEKFRKTVARLETLRLRSPSQSLKVGREKRYTKPRVKNITLTHQKIRQIHTLLSQRNKYAFTAVEWIFPELRLRRETESVTPGWMTCDTTWNKTYEGFKQEFRTLCADLDAQAKLPVAAQPSLHPVTHKVSFLGNLRLTKTLSKVAAKGTVSADQFTHAMRIDDLAKQYHLFAVPKNLIHRGEVNSIASWIESQLIIGLPNKRELLGNPQEWQDWINRDSANKTSEYRTRIGYLDKLCKNVFPKFNLTVLTAPAGHRSRGKKSDLKRGN